MVERAKSWLARLVEFVTRHTLLLISLVTITSMFMAFVYLSGESKKIMRETSIIGAQRYLEALAEFRTLYTSEVVKTAKKHGLMVTHDYLNQAAAIPLPATFSMKLGERIGAHQSGAKTFLYSPYPFPWRKQENSRLFSQPFVQSAWKQLQETPKKPFYRFENYNGRPSIRFAVADQLRESCVNCHNSHPDTPKNDWAVGDVRGVLEVILPINVAQTQSENNLRATFLVLTLMTVLLALVLSVVFTRLSKDTQALSSKNLGLKRQQAEIESQNNSITQANEQLQKRSIELEQAMQTKSEFLACMSHEIRTPMNGVLGMLGLLLKESLTKSQQHKANLAQSSAQSLLVLINDILDFSKIDAGKLELETIDFNLVKMLNEVTQTMALRVEDKDLELVLDTAQIHTPMIKGDPGRIRQIITNLLGNAIKFTEQGEVVVRASIQAHQVNQEQITLTCSVTDTGIGIPEEQHASLFEVFTQVDASTTRKYGGTGLGLSICKKLCQQMGGDIQVTSTTEKGSCFEFNLSLLKSQKVCQAIPTAKIKDLLILIVDDNYTNLEVLRGQLEYWGAQVIAVNSGLGALKILEKHHQNRNRQAINLALIDMQMPEMDGAQLASKLQSDSRFDTLKLIMMTSMTRHGDAQFFANLGFSGYFSKPVSPSDLFDALVVITEGGDILQQASPLVTRHYLRALDHDHAPAYDEKVDPALTVNGEACRVLLVEDNQINQLVAMNTLENLGLKVEVANNGIKALKMLNASPQHAPYNLILMDCQMPQMDGYETTKAIRKGDGSNRYCKVIVIAMTANAMKGDREKCLAVGMDDYISKPFKENELQSILARWLTDTENKE